MSKATTQHIDRIVIAALEDELRFQRDLPGTSRRDRYDGFAPMDVKRLARRTGLSAGRVRGAIERGIKAGTVVEVNEKRGRWGADYTTPRLLREAEQRERDKRIAELRDEKSDQARRDVLDDHAQNLYGLLSRLQEAIPDCDDPIDLQLGANDLVEAWRLIHRVLTAIKS